MSGGGLAVGRTRRAAALVMVALAMVAGVAHAQPAQRGGANNAGGEEDAGRRARTRLELASAYYAEGRYDTALEEVQRALAANADMPQALNLRGLIYSALNDEPQAEDSFKRALRVAPEDTDTLHNYGWYMCQRGRYAEAETQFKRLLAIPTYRTPSRTLLVQGICEARAGKLEQAEATLKRSYELDAANPATAMNLGAVLYRRGEFERARFYVRRVNGNGELRNAESLWLAARIENKLGNAQGVRDLGNQLRASYPNAREAAMFERGAFDE
jgi:type IV pilus assembly protein PilF